MSCQMQKDPDLQATEKIYRKIMSTGRDTGRFSSPSPHLSIGRKSGHPTSRSTVLAEKQMNRHFPDANMEAALKRAHDGTTHRSFSPASTVHTGQTVHSKKRAVSTGHSPVKSPASHFKAEKYLTGVPFEKKILHVENSERWNRSYQALRLEKEWTELNTCRNMKRNSEIVRHRVDNMYMMSGSGIRLKPKYDVNEDELQQLKDLSRARQVLRDKARKNQPTPKGKKMNSESGKKSAKKEATQPEIHIDGEAARDGSRGEKPPSAEWASDPDSRPHPSPNNSDTNGDKANVDERNENGGDKVEENLGVRSESQPLSKSEDAVEAAEEQEEKPSGPLRDLLEGEKRTKEDEDSGDGPDRVGGGDKLKDEGDEEAEEQHPDPESQDRADIKEGSKGGNEKEDGEQDLQGDTLEDVEGERQVDKGDEELEAKEKIDS